MALDVKVVSISHCRNKKQLHINIQWHHSRLAFIIVFSIGRLPLDKELCFVECSLDMIAVID